MSSTARFTVSIYVLQWSSVAYQGIFNRFENVILMFTSLYMFLLQSWELFLIFLLLTSLWCKQWGGGNLVAEIILLFPFIGATHCIVERQLNLLFALCWWILLQGEMHWTVSMAIGDYACNLILFILFISQAPLNIEARMFSWEIPRCTWASDFPDRVKFRYNPSV